jgi:hypothetical protein
MRDRLLHKILNELTGVPTYRKAAAIIDPCLRRKYERRTRRDTRHTKPSAKAK